MFLMLWIILNITSDIENKQHNRIFRRLILDNQERKNNFKFFLNKLLTEYCQFNGTVKGKIPKLWFGY